MQSEGSGATRSSLRTGSAADGEPVDMSFLRGGSGKPVVLLHGFASNAQEDWIDTGWFEGLTALGHDVVAPDLRGHGLSFKSHNPADYTLSTFTADVLALCNACWADKALGLVGYSMGAHVAMSSAMAIPDRIASIVLGGMGDRIAATVGLAPEFADALDIEAAQIGKGGAQLPDYAVRFRQHAASRPFNDLRALAACLRGQSCVFDLAGLAVVQAPTLVLAGEKDKLAGSPYRVAALFPKGIGGKSPGVSHASALANHAFRSRAIVHLDATSLNAWGQSQNDERNNNKQARDA